MQVAEPHQCVEWQIDGVNDKVQNRVKGPKHGTELDFASIQKGYVDRSVKALMSPKQCGGHLIKVLSYAVGHAILCITIAF